VELYLHSSVRLHGILPFQEGNFAFAVMHSNVFVEVLSTSEGTGVLDTTCVPGS
jgi:hypothetical protein